MLAIGPKMLAEQDKEKLLFDVVDEQIDIAARTSGGSASLALGAMTTSSIPLLRRLLRVGRYF